MKKMKIRQAKTSDRLLLAEVIKKSYATVAQRYGLTIENCPKHPSNCSLEWIEKDMERGVQYYMIESGETVVGCMALEKADEKTCYLERLAVIPEKRNQGVGLRLVHHFLKEAESKELEKVGIGIIAEQQDLKQWYQKIGFVETGRKSFSHLPFEVCFMEFPIKKNA